MEPFLRPVEEQRRIISLDAMRGFAILGIFLVNMLSFHSPFLYIEPLEQWSNPIEKGLYIFIDTFAQASFYPLFSMLFGYGLIILWERTKQKEISFGTIIGRRLFLLMLIGILHALLIWHGDILFNYALLGFVFLLFIRLSGKGMLILGSTMYLLPNLFFLGLFFLTLLLMQGEEISLSVPALASQSMDIYHNGTFLEITKQRIEDWTYTNNFLGLFMMLFTILPLFLIGAGAAKYKWLEQVKKYEKGIVLTGILTFALGILLKMMPYIASPTLVFTYLQDYFGGPLLAISYGLMIALLAEKGYFKKLLLPLSTVGRMSLTNYLIQSIISTLIFYSYGFGFYGEVSIMTGTVLVIVIYLGQILFSRVWMNHYYYGPVEWLWRNITYWKKQPFRRLQRKTN